MRYTTRTEYGMVCLAHMARKFLDNGNSIVTVKEIAEKERFSITYVEKILQSLRAANIVVSHQGKQGGFSLSRHPSEITLKVIIEALEGHTFDVFCEPDVRSHIVCTHFCMCGVKPLWAKTKTLLDDFYGSITLEMIAKQEHEVQSLIGTKKVEVAKE